MDSHVLYNNNFAAISEHHLINNTHQPTGAVMDMQLESLSNRNKNRKRNRNNPPRPCNSFMIYRREYHQWIKQHCPFVVLSEVSFISKSAAYEWSLEPQYVKEIYIEKARIEREQHMMLYPNYEYHPRRTRGYRNYSKGSLDKMTVKFLLNDESDTIHPCTNSPTQEGSFQSI